MRILCKKMLRRTVFFLLLLIAPILVSRIPGTDGLPTAGFYMPDESAMASRVAAQLVQNGFVSLPDPGQIPQMVQAGELDCGVVFPEDFSQRVASGDLRESLVFYTSPASMIPELFRSHVAAAVFKEYVPYITVEAFVETDISEETVLQMYESLFADGYAFSFEIQTVSGTAVAEDPRARSVTMGTVAILMSTVLFALCAETEHRSFRVMLGRLGLCKSMAHILIPEILLSTCLAALFCGAGLIAAGFGDLVPAVFVYGCLISGVGLLLASVLGNAKGVYLLLPVTVICAVALCPVYIDLALVIPAAANVRWLLPAYWFWPIVQRPILWSLPALAILSLGFFVVFIRFGVFQKYSRKKGS